MNITKIVRRKRYQENQNEPYRHRAFPLVVVPASNTSSVSFYWYSSLRLGCLHHLEKYLRSINLKK